MRTTRPLIAGLLAVLLASGGPVEAVSPAEAADPPGRLPAPSESTVTLVTGDRVTVTDQGGLAVHRGAGRDDIMFLTDQSEDHHYVIPSDALGMVRDGRLDRRLFNVSLLRQFAYDDPRADLPLIITGRRAPATLIDATDGNELPAVAGVAAKVDKTELGDFWNGLTIPAAGQPGTRTLTTGVSTVWLDGLRQPALDESVAQVGAPAAWQRGLDGTGTTVAVLDTGIDLAHTDLADRVAASENFTEEADRDLVGHGTHVASILAGSGAASDGRFRGVAPGARLLDGKVCMEIGCAESSLLAGMQWAAEQGADVVNMSLGGRDEPGLDPVEQALETLTDEFGVLFVVAAGNSAPHNSRVSSPASADSAVAVGAVDKADQLYEFSLGGPRIDGGLKPDLTAPGEDITAARSKDGFVGEPGQPYVALSGTSMATPHVAGAAAILAQQYPDWTPEQLKAALMGSAEPHPQLVPYDQGAGRLDLARAISQTVTASPASVGFDRTVWPHGDDRRQTRTVAYRNDGDADIRLELALSATGPDGQPAPDGFFTLDVTTVTVPAGGSADVTITADTSVGEADGFFGGYLTASGPATVVTTPFAVDREVESYELTLAHTDRSGAPVTEYGTSLYRLDEFDILHISSPLAAPTVRVPAGEYTLSSFIIVNAGDGIALVAYPRLVVDRDLTVAVDAGMARPISVTVPEPTAAPIFAAARMQTTTVGHIVGSGVSGDLDRVFTGQIGPDQPAEGFASAVFASWGKPNPDHPDDEFAGTPYSYHLAWYERGRMLTGLTRDVKPRNLATVHTHHAAHVPGALGFRYSFPIHPAIEFPVAATLQDGLPFRRTEYYNTDGGLQWLRWFDEVHPDEGLLAAATEDGPTTFRAGHTYHEHWNQAVFGPVLPRGAPVVSRLGDELSIEPQLYGDSAGRPASTPAEGAITVYRDGEQIAEIPELSATVELSPEPAELRVKVQATRDPWLPLSTSTSLVWTFRSAHADRDTPLPVSVVRFTPRLDEHNTAPAGRRFLVPVEVQSQPGSEPGRVSRLTVEVSFDDGATWRRIPVLPSHLAQVTHPAGAGFVSLRATATHHDGSTVEQTVIRAYAMG